MNNGKVIDIDVLERFFRLYFMDYPEPLPKEFVRVSRSDDIWGEPTLRVFIGAREASIQEDGTSPGSGGSLVGPWKIEYVGCK